MNSTIRTSGSSVALILFTGLFALPARSQEMTNDGARSLLDSYTAWAKLLILDERRDVRKVLSLGELSRERDIDYEVDNTNGVRAFAYKDPKDHSKDYIVISAGLVEIIDFYSTAYALAGAYGANACADSYYDYANNVVLANDRAAANGSSLNFQLGPIEYLVKHRDICPQVTRDAFKSNKTAASLRELAIEACLRMVLAHELGHHLLNHTSTRSQSLEDSRQRETAADAFAIRTLIAEKINPIVAVPVMILFCGVEGYSADNEFRSDHPAAARRVLAMLTAGRDQVRADPTLSASLKQKLEAYIDTAMKDVRESVRPGGSDSPEENSPTKHSSSFAGIPGEGEKLHEIEHDHLPPAPALREGAYCGTIQGIHVCQLGTPLLLGTNCGCFGTSGYGVVVQ